MYTKKPFAWSRVIDLDVVWLVYKLESNALAIQYLVNQQIKSLDRQVYLAAEWNIKAYPTFSHDQS